MPFSIERNDLALMEVDAIVIAANEYLKIGGGVGEAVARVAGVEELQAACDELAPCPTGHAVATPGFALPARLIVHAVGPVWIDGDHGEEQLLAQTYASALECAVEHDARTIAMPLISAGSFGFDPALSFAIAREAVRDFLEEHEAYVRLVLWDKRAVEACVPHYGEIARYIDDHYVEEHRPTYGQTQFSYAQTLPAPTEAPSAQLFCPRCGSALPEGSAFCLSCGEHVARTDSSYQQRQAAPPAQAAEQLAPPAAHGKQGRFFGRLTEALSSLGERGKGAEKARELDVFELQEEAISEEMTEEPLMSYAASMEPSALEELQEPYPPAASYAPAETYAPTASNAPEWESYEFDQLQAPYAPTSEEFPTYDAGSGFSAQQVGSAPKPTDLSQWLDGVDAPFSTTLLELIDARGLKDSVVYKRANMSRQLFSRIRSNPEYRPSKSTVIALAIALHLNLQETEDLLRRAGFAFSPSSKADLIVQYHILNGEYNIMTINATLFAFDQPLL